MTTVDVSTAEVAFCAGAVTAPLPLIAVRRPWATDAKKRENADPPSSPASFLSPFTRVAFSLPTGAAFSVVAAVSIASRAAAVAVAVGLASPAAARLYGCAPFLASCAVARFVSGRPAVRVGSRRTRNGSRSRRQAGLEWSVCPLQGVDHSSTLPKKKVLYLAGPLTKYVLSETTAGDTLYGKSDYTATP